MTEEFKETVLKGGSLNKTVLREFTDGRRVVRKSVARFADREYGFVRWHSQFKRLQRFNRVFPGLFAEVTAAGCDGDTAFYEMDFVEGSTDIKVFLAGAPDAASIAALHVGLWTCLDRLHDAVRFQAYRGTLALYFQEEVTQRLSDAMQNLAFREFCLQEEIVVDGQPYQSLVHHLEWLKRAFDGATIREECYTHGNITLENALFVPSQSRIVFIDPYDENVVDCREAEYSQVLQCSDHLYGYINDRSVTVKGNLVSSTSERLPGFEHFNALFKAELDRRLDTERIWVVRLLEASQFVRMLPFKVAAGDIEKAKYFFGVASKLTHKLRNDLN